MCQNECYPMAALFCLFSVSFLLIVPCGLESEI